MLKDAINSGGIPKNSEKSTGEKISEEKENSAEKRNDEKQNFSQRTEKKEKTNRKNNKKSNIIREENLPPEIVKASGKTDISIPLGIPLEEAEKIIIEQNLAANKGNKSKTAEILGIERKTLTNKLQ